MLHAGYEYLRTCPPFRGWKLPHADHVEFHVTRFKDRTGDCDCWSNGTHIVRVSSCLVGWTDSLLRALAHEMVHIHLDRKGVRGHHGRDFTRCAAQVCRHHGFDPKLF